MSINRYSKTDILSPGKYNFIETENSHSLVTSIEATLRDGGSLSGVAKVLQGLHWEPQERRVVGTWTRSGTLRVYLCISGIEASGNFQGLTNSNNDIKKLVGTWHPVDTEWGTFDFSLTITKVDDDKSETSPLKSTYGVRNRSKSSDAVGLQRRFALENKLNTLHENTTNITKDYDKPKINEEQKVYSRNYKLGDISKKYEPGRKNEEEKMDEQLISFSDVSRGSVRERTEKKRSLSGSQDRDRKERIKKFKEELARKKEEKKKEEHQLHHVKFQETPMLISDNKEKVTEPKITLQKRENESKEKNIQTDESQKKEKNKSVAPNATIDSNQEEEARRRKIEEKKRELYAKKEALQKKAEEEQLKLKEWQESLKNSYRERGQTKVMDIKEREEMMLAFMKEWDIKNTAISFITPRIQHEATLRKIEAKDGKYIIGKGGFGAIYLVEFNETLAAMKILDSPPNEEDVARGEFLQELDILMRLRHPNILLYLGGSALENQLFFLTELMESDLHRLILKKDPHALWQSNGKNYAIDIIRGLTYIHGKNLVHKDMKSGNILVNRGVAKLADFGLAKTIESKAIKITHERAYSAAWASPEQLNPHTTISFPTDIYSFAIIVWEIICNSQPWDGFTDLQMMFATASAKFIDYHPLPKECPSDIKELLYKCWQFEPSLRPTAKECLITLETKTYQF